MAEPLAIGLEIGGTKLQAAVGRGDGTLLDTERRAIDPARGAEGVLQLALDAVHALRARPPAAGAAITGLGVGFGGPVDPEAGRVVTSHQVEGWNGFPLADRLRAELGLDRVVVRNDSDTAALAEARLGAGAGFSPVLYVNSGSGVGGGLVVDGRIYRGGSGIGAVEFGHMRVPALAAIPTETAPGGTAALEEVASGWAIGRRAAAWVARFGRAPGRHPSPLLALSQRDPGRVTAALVAEAAHAGDPIALQVLHEATLAYGSCLAQAITLLAPQRIVLGGGVALMPAELWLEPIREVVRRQVFPPFRDRFAILPAQLGETVVLHGALALILDQVPRQPPR